MHKCTQLMLGLDMFFCVFIRISSYAISFFSVAPSSTTICTMIPTIKRLPSVYCGHRTGGHLRHDSVGTHIAVVFSMLVSFFLLPCFYYSCAYARQVSGSQYVCAGECGECAVQVSDAQTSVHCRWDDRMAEKEKKKKHWRWLRSCMCMNIQVF